MNLLIPTALCPNCGNPVDANNRVCTDCHFGGGTPVIGQKGKLPPPPPFRKTSHQHLPPPPFPQKGLAPPPPPKIVQRDSEDRKIATSPKQKNPGNKKALRLVFLLLVIIGIFAAYSFLNGFDQPATLPPDSTPEDPLGLFSDQQDNPGSKLDEETQIESQPTSEQSAQQQQTPEIYYVITAEGNNLFLRKSPGFLNKKTDDIITRLPRGSALEISNKHSNSIAVDGFTWWEIRSTGSEISGWVASEYISTDPNQVRD